MYEGNRYCGRCMRFFAMSVVPDAKPIPDSVREKSAPKERKPRGCIKWWDAKAREWRWVSKRSKPELKPVGE